PLLRATPYPFAKKILSSQGTPLKYVLTQNTQSTLRQALAQSPTFTHLVVMVSAWIRTYTVVTLCLLFMIPSLRKLSLGAQTAIPPSKECKTPSTKLLSKVFTAMWPCIVIRYSATKTLQRAA